MKMRFKSCLKESYTCSRRSNLGIIIIIYKTIDNDSEIDDNYNNNNNNIIFHKS